jgi:mRNA-degrading endonuclease RelE of RelBE toxin-antitoxin system
LAKHLVFVEAKAQKQFRKLPKASHERISTLQKEMLSSSLDVKKLSKALPRKDW